MTIFSYARAQRRRPWRFWAILILSSIALACAKWAPLRAYFEQAHYVWLQRQALNHSAPSEQVAFEPDSKTAAALLTAHPKLYSQPSPIPWDTAQKKARFEKHWTEVAFYTPPVLRRIWPKRWLADGVLFLHRRHNAAGQERLAIVLIRMMNVSSPGDDMLWLTGYVCQPASFQPGSRLGVPTSATLPQIQIERQHEPLRFFMGQADPNDLTHFTIAFEAENRRGTIDGWLRLPDNQHASEYIVLKVRDEHLFTIYGL